MCRPCCLFFPFGDLYLTFIDSLDVALSDAQEQSKGHMNSCGRVPALRDNLLPLCRTINQFTAAYVNVASSGYLL